MTTLKTLGGLALAALFVTSCGGSTNSPSSPTTPGQTTYAVGGTVSGLTASGLVLGYSGDNGRTGSLAVSASGSFTFSAATTGAVAGTRYTVTATAQPANQTCTVDPATATGLVANADVTSVRVICVAGSQQPPPGGTSANCMIPVPGFNGTYAISGQSGANYRISVTGSASAPVETSTLDANGGTVTSRTQYQVATASNGSKQLSWSTTHTETNAQGATIIVDQTVPQSLTLPMQPAAVQRLDGAITGSVSITAPGFSCQAQLSGTQSSSMQFVGIEQVTVPAGTFSACRFSFERVTTLEFNCPRSTANGNADDHLTIWAADGVGMVKTLNTKDGSTTELLTR